MYKINGEQYSQEDLQEIADIKGYTVDELLNKNPEIEEIKVDEGKTNPTTQGAENVDVTQAPNTEFSLEPGSSGFTKEGEIVLSGKEIADNQFAVKPVELEEVVVTGDGTKFKKKQDRIAKEKADANKRLEAFDNQFRIKQIAAVTKMPEFGVSVAAGVAATTVDITKGFLDLADKYGVAPLNYAIGTALGFDTTFEKEARDSAGSFDAIDEVTDLLRKYTIKKYDKDGNEQDIYGLIEQDNYADAAELALSQGFSAAPYLAMSIASPVYGSALIGASVTGQEVDDALKDRENATMSEIYGASLLKGGVEFATNAIGGGIQRGILGIGKKLGVGTNAYKDAVKIYTKTYAGKLADSVLGLTKGGATNFVEEFSASMLTSGVDQLVYGDKKEWYGEARLAFNEGVAGLALGAPIGGAGAFKSVATKQQALEFIAPKKWTAELSKMSKKLAETNLDLKNANSKRREKALKKKVAKQEKNIASKKQALYDSFDSMTKKEKFQYAENLAKMDDAIGVINNNKFSKESQEEARNELIKAATENQKLAGEKKYDAKVEAALTKQLRFAERIFAQGKKLKGVNKEDLTIEYINKDQALDLGFDKNSGGAHFRSKDGKSTMFIVADVASGTEQTNVIGHEFLHYLLSRKFKTDNASMEPMVNEFKAYAKSVLDPAVYERIETRINTVYSENGKIKKGDLEEYFTVFADLVSQEKIDIKEGLVDKLKNSIQGAIQGLGFTSAKLDTGKDMFNFIRNYSKNINRFGFKKLGKDFTSTVLKAQDAIIEEQKKFSKQDLASEKVQQIYEEQGEAGAMDIIEQFKPITSRLANKYRDVPGFDFELLQSEIEIGKRGLFDLIQSYNPDKGVPLAAHINTNLARRSIEAAQRILKTDFELDVTESKGVTATESATDIVEQQEEIEATPVQEIKSLRKEIGLDDGLVSTVKDAVIKTFGTKLPNPEDSKFRLELQRRFRTELKKPIAKFAGTRANYENFLRDNFEAIYDKLPQSILNKRFDEFIEPALDENGKQLREKTAEGNKIFTKKKISKAEFIKYFLGAELGSSTKGARKTAIVEAIAEEVAFDATMEVLRDPDVSQKYQDIAELTGEVLPENFKELISKQIDRGEDFKFSKGLAKESGLSTQELNRLLSMSMIEIAKGNPEIAQAIYDEAWVKSFPRDFENIILPGLANAVKKAETKQEKAALVYQFIKLYSRPIRTASTQLDLGLTKNDAILRVIRKALGDEAKGIIGFSGKQNIIHRVKQGKNTLLFYGDEKINAVQYDITDNSVKQKIVDGQISKDEVLNQNILASNNLKDLIFILGETNPGLALSTIKLMQKDNRSDFRTAAMLNSVVQNYKGKLTYEHNPPTNIVYNEIVEYLKNPTKEGKEKLLNTLNTWEANVVPTDFANIVDENYRDTMPSDGLRYKEAMAQTNYTFDNEFKFSKTLAGELGDIIESKSGIAKTVKMSEKRAAELGKGKSRFNVFVPSNADDFVGLLYRTLDSGKAGEKQMEFYKNTLLTPFAQGIREFTSKKEQTMRELRLIKKGINKTKAKLKAKNETGFSNETAARVYLWGKNGYEIPGLNKGEIKDLIKVVNNNKDLKEFALNVQAVAREFGYPAPENNWEAGTITTDMLEMVNTSSRKQSLAKFIDNKNQMFNKNNLNKLEAAFGKDYRISLEDALGRMESGRKRYTGMDKETNMLMDWLNGSVGTIMFFNSRSAVLQLLSVANFTNFSDNNIFKQGLAFANQKQYWKDFSTIANSDFIKQRVSGLKNDVNADDIAEAASDSKNKAKSVIASLLKAGFLPTQAADAFAIASGGAAFYRNRINKYVKEGLAVKEAENKAFLDFQEIAEETQQSSRDDRISKVQSGSLGRIVFAFGNTPMQYARIIKKASSDLINGRGDWKSNVSRILYYGAMQNIIFSFLQNAGFAIFLGDSEDEEKEEEKYFRMANSVADSLLRGSGLPGAILSTFKNVAIEGLNQLEKDRPQMWKAGLQATSLSPPLNAKVRKYVNASARLGYKSTWKDMENKGFSLDNPAFQIGGDFVSATANVPVDRVLRKFENLEAATSDEAAMWQSVALGLGWNKWDLGLVEKNVKKSTSKNFKIKKPKLKRPSLKR